MSVWLQTLGSQLTQWKQFSGWDNRQKLSNLSWGVHHITLDKRRDAALTFCLFIFSSVGRRNVLHLQSCSYSHRCAWLPYGLNEFKCLSAVMSFIKYWLLYIEAIGGERTRMFLDSVTKCSFVHTTMKTLNKHIMKYWNHALTLCTSLKWFKMIFQ